MAKGVYSTKKKSGGKYEDCKAFSGNLISREGKKTVTRNEKLITVIDYAISKYTILDLRN